jgi:hypothetical protein
VTVDGTKTRIKVPTDENMEGMYRKVVARQMEGCRTWKVMFWRNLQPPSSG